MSEGVPEKLSANNLSSHLSNSNLYVNKDVSQYEGLQGLSLISKFEKSIQVLDFVLTCFATSPLSPLIMNLSRRAEECTYKWFF